MQLSDWEANCSSARQALDLDFPSNQAPSQKSNGVWVSTGSKYPPNTTTSFKISGSVEGFWWVFKSEGKSKRSFPSIFPRIFFYHLLKSVIKVEMEMQFRTLSYTQGQKPQPYTRSSMSALHSPASWLYLTLAMSTSGAGHQHPLCPAFTISGRWILIGGKSLLPLVSYGIFHCPCFCSSLFFSFFWKTSQKRSLHSLAFLSHIPLNPQPTAIWL